MIRIERQVEIGAGPRDQSDSVVYGREEIWPEVRRTLSVEVREDADAFEVARALRALEGIADIVRRLSPCCGVPWDALHAPECGFAPDGLIANAHADAVAEGMRP